MSLALGDEAPHIFTRKPRQRPLEFLMLGEKRLLQHNPSNSYLNIAVLQTNAIAKSGPTTPASGVVGTKRQIFRAASKTRQRRPGKRGKEKPAPKRDAGYKEQR